jgi:hypothetical protein
LATGRHPRSVPPAPLILRNSPPRQRQAGGCQRVLCCAQHLAWKHPDQIDRQIPANSFDVLRRCAREQNSDPLRHFAQIAVLVGQYDNDLGVEFRTDLIGHFRTPRFPAEVYCLGCHIWLPNRNTSSLSARVPKLLGRSYSPASSPCASRLNNRATVTGRQRWVPAGVGIPRRVSSAAIVVNDVVPAALRSSRIGKR